MTELEYQEHIRRTHSAYCKIVIHHAAINTALCLRKLFMCGKVSHMNLIDICSLSNN